MSIIGLKTKNGVIYDGLVYDDSQLRELINSKVSAIDGYSLVADSEITRLSKVVNYDDTQLRQAIQNNTGSVNITQAVLNFQIPTDNNSDVDDLDVTIKLCKYPDMQKDLIEINNIQHHQIMQIAFDTEFTPLSEWLDEDDNTTPKIPYTYFNGTLTVKLTANDVEGFDPNSTWYAMALWSNGNITAQSQLIQFMYSGFCRMPRMTV